MVTIRKALTDDCKQIAKVHVDSWGTTYQGVVADSYLQSLSYEEKEKFWKEVANLDNVFVAEENDEVIGFISFGKSSHPSFEGEIYAIYLVEKAQRKGIGRKLFIKALEALKQHKIDSCIVWALEENCYRSFYEKFEPEVVDSAFIEIAGKKHREIAYGYRSIEKILPQ